MKKSAELSVGAFHQLITLGTYGNFLAVWSSFEIVVEVILMRQLRLRTEETSIVFSSLGFGAKMSILTALLNRDPANTLGVQLLKKAQTDAERNSFAHGFFRVERDDHSFILIRREVKDVYTVKRKKYGFNEMDAHLQKFLEAVIAVRGHFNELESDLDAYGKQIEDFALAREARGTLHPESPTSSPKAKRKPRPARRK